VLLMAVLAGAVVYFLQNNPFNRPPASPTSTPAPFAMVSTATSAAPVNTLAPTPTLDLSPDLAVDSVIVIPSLNINARIVQVYLEGSTWNVSRLGPNAGHLEGTPWIEQTGNVVLSGHVELADGQLGVFAKLNTIQAGAEILVASGGLRRTYRVRETYFTDPDDLRPLYPTRTDVLTLITCDAYNLLTNVYEKRLIVVAERET
jgi:LPXTG-site transpeptidase (sortase) family protein